MTLSIIPPCFVFESTKLPSAVCRHRSDRITCSAHTPSHSHRRHPP